MHQWSQIKDLRWQTGARGSFERQRLFLLMANPFARASHFEATPMAAQASS